jgi:hypothetical protein
MDLQAALIVNSQGVLVAVEDGQFPKPCHVVLKNGVELYLADGGDDNVYVKDKASGLWLMPHTSEKFRLYFYPKGWWLLDHLANGTIERLITAGLITLNRDQTFLCSLLHDFIEDMSQEILEGIAHEDLEERALDSARRLQIILKMCTKN